MVIPDPAQQPLVQTVGIRELKQNPSEIIARAATGVRFDVVSRGKPVGVVIVREGALRSRWVSAHAMVALSAAAQASDHASDHAWASENRAERDRTEDPIVDPWDSVS